MSKLWFFAIPAPLVMLMGVYLAGGTEVVCSRVDASGELAAGASRPAVVGACRVKTTRWLGREIVEDRTYLRVTGMDRIAAQREDSEGSRNRNSTKRTVTDWSLALMSHDVEVARFGGARKRVDLAYGKGAVWFGGNAGSPLTLDFTEWQFMFGAFVFGTVWLVVIALSARLPGMGTVSRRKRRPRIQAT